MGLLLDLGADHRETVPAGPECVVSLVECPPGAADLNFLVAPPPVSVKTGLAAIGAALASRCSSATLRTSSALA